MCAAPSADGDIRRAEAIGLLENSGEHIHLCHTIANLCDAVDNRVLCTDGSEHRDETNPCLADIAEQAELECIGRQDVHSADLCVPIR